MNVLGIMSGTSLGSVDYALCSITDKSVKLRELWSVDYPKPLQKLLHSAARGDLKSWQFSQVHHDLGRFYAQHARSGKLKPALIGLHGQTVFHNPDLSNPATFQLGEAAYLVQQCRAPVVNNFRAADMAAGGQGAPLATIFHRFVFAERGKHVCLHNLGGISNVTSMDWKKGGAAAPRILAFDTGPANMLIDFAMRHHSKGKLEFDADGSWAAKGAPSEELLKKWLRHPYFREAPPKSTGRELFGEPFFQTAMREARHLSKYDLVATFTEFTARSVALNYQLHLGSPADKVVLTGGGGSNPILIGAIARALKLLEGGAGTEVITSEELGWPVQSIEPAAFALLAWLRFTGKPGNIPTTTGASGPVLCGQISAP